SVWYVLALSFATTLSSAKTLDIVVKVPSFTPFSKIYVTGDILELCSWKPDCRMMAPRFANTYETSVQIRDATEQVELKVTRGSWSREAADWRARPVENLIVPTASASSQVIVTVVNWSDLPPMGVTGHLDIYQKFYSPQLSNWRNVEVWLPPG